MVLACAAACVAAESFLCMDVCAQESDFEATLKDNILTLSSRAVRDSIITADRQDTLLAYVNDSIPKDSPQLRISILKGILTEIDRQYDKVIPKGNIFQSIPKELILSMIPGILPIPETYTDPKREIFLKQMESVSAVKADIAESFALSRPLVLPDWAAGIGRLLFGLGLPPSRNAIPVMNGLYFIYMPGGQPLEFDESVFKDRKHFDPEVYKFSKPQMQYDLHEGLHFKANNLP